jgi:hypothetical protein
MKVKIRAPQTLDQMRRLGCSKEKIENWFTAHQGVLDRSEWLIINADETHVHSNRKFKVLTPIGKRPIQVNPEVMPHFSAMCAISGSGHAFHPMFILPGNLNMPLELEEFQDRAYFTSTESGWMNRKCFLLWTFFMCDEIRQYRYGLRVNLRHQEILLLLDGHSSRWSREAISLFKKHNVGVLILVAHSTHATQPFDVSVAAPLKTALGKARDLATFSVTENEHHELQVNRISEKFLAQKRKMMMGCFLSAWSRAAHIDNIRSGFEKSGICPYDPQKPLNCGFIAPSAADEAPPSPRHGEFSGKLVTSPECLNRLNTDPSYSVFGGRDMTAVEMLSELMYKKDLSNSGAAFLSAPSGFIWDFRRLNSQTPLKEAPRWLARELPHCNQKEEFQIIFTTAASLAI